MKGFFYMEHFYYNIAVPLNVSNLYTYKSKENIKSGIRVLIKFSNAIYTGIVISIEENINKEIKYQEIIEIIDKEPILSGEMLKFANWISEYYHVALGLVLSSMVPTALNVQYLQRIKKIKDAIISGSDSTIEMILLKLSKLKYIEFEDLRAELEISNLYYWLEKMEDDGVIEIERKIDEKIKNKVANFIILRNENYENKLPTRQQELYDKIRKIGKEFKLSIIAKEFSYSIVKGLQEKDIIKIEPRVIEDKSKNIFENIDVKEQKEIKYTDEQNKIINDLKENLNLNKFIPFLLFGVTGSGKTEIYIKIIEEVINRGKSAILLLPEISLTPQILAKFYTKFRDKIAVMHSHLTEREKYHQWRSINNMESKVVIGARSAIFAPVKNLGIIIVDEEHETSYKQDKNPRYNARDLAVVRAKMNNAIVILGTATPSLESWYNVHSNKYKLLQLKKRPFRFSMPEIEIVDMRKEEKKQGNFSKQLLQEIEKRLEKKEQVILFQNRRGHSSFVQCVNCGKLFKCPNCEISLHYHSVTSELKCHYCGYSKPLPRKCPECGSYLYNFGSPGTQQIEKELKILFPTAKIMRMDSDTTARKESYQEMFDRMKNKEVDILLGTQMISKGLDFHNVTLVGVISADVILNYPDFRSSERTFQLLTQVAGRSGRGEKTGKVIIQTYNPEHYAITYSLQGDFELFAIEEMKFRKILKYPPYYRMARIVFLHKNYEFLKESLDKNRYLINKLKEYLPQISILGPVAPPIIKIRNEFRMHIIIKAKMPSEISKAIGYINNNFKIGSSIKKIIDIDAYSLI